jgi:hypothetical protein
MLKLNDLIVVDHTDGDRYSTVSLCHRARYHD